MEIMGGRGLIPMVTCVPSLIWDLQNSKWMLQQEQEATGKRECKRGKDGCRFFLHVEGCGDVAAQLYTMGTAWP